jgi:hypothetical protein
MKPLLTEQTAHISFEDRIRTKVTWSRTKDPIAFWRAQVGSEIWTARVNDFPEEHLYTLFVNGQEIGSLDEWPRQWLRAQDLSSGDST